VRTEIFFGKSEIKLDNPADKQPDGQITSVESSSAGQSTALIDALIVEQIN
jgi:hypothetical protein